MRIENVKQNCETFRWAYIQHFECHLMVNYKRYNLVVHLVVKCVWLPKLYYIQHEKK